MEMFALWNEFTLNLRFNQTCKNSYHDFKLCPNQKDNIFAKMTRCESLVCCLFLFFFFGRGIRGRHTAGVYVSSKIV